MNRLLRWVIARVCADEDRPFVLSDLEEGYDRLAAERGRRAADRWLRRQVITSMRPCLTRRRTLARRANAHRHPGDGWTLADRLGAWVADIGYAVRSLRSERLVVVLTVVSIGFGVGAMTTVFAVANAMLIRDPGGVSDPEELVTLYTTRPGGSDYGETSFPDYLELADRASAFGPIAAWRAGGLTLVDELGERTLFIEAVTDGYFDALGSDFALGRGFVADEVRPGSAEPVVVISHRLWTERYGGSPDALGRVLELDGRAFTVIGVAHPDLRGRFLEINVDAWVPIGLPGGVSRSTEQEIANRNDRDYGVIARVRPGTSLEQAETQLASLAEGLRAEHPDAWIDDRGDRRFTLLVGAAGGLPPEGRLAMVALTGVLMAGGAFVLLIACANVAGLFIARGDRRARELAIRASLGASNGRIVRLLLSEALLLCVLASLAAVGVTHVASRTLMNLPIPVDIPLGLSVRLDPAVMVFALLTALGAGLLFGLLPAWRARSPNLVQGLKGTPARRRVRRFGVRQLLVAGQVAGSLVLLVATGLATRSIDHVSSVDIGFEADGIAVASVDLSRAVPQASAEGAAASAATTEERLDRLVRALEERPGVREVAVSSTPEGSVFLSDIRQALLDVPGASSSAGATPTVAFNAVSGGYFDLMRMPVLRGRAIDARDVASDARVAVVNEAFADRFWNGEDPIGRSFTLRAIGASDSFDPTDDASYTVVGVARGIHLDPLAAPRPFLWIGLLPAATLGDLILHVRGAEDVAVAVQDLDRELRREGLQPSLFRPQPYADIVDEAYAVSRLAGRVLAWSGLFTLLLASGGIFGVVTYTVARRTPEMAVRRAIGASGPQVVTAVVRDAMRVVMAGVGVGLLVVGLAAPVARGALYGLAPLDPIALLGGTGALVVAALVASWWPARRITAIHPRDALREQ